MNDMDLLEIPFGVRYVGFWEQQPVTKKEDIVNLVEEHLGIDPLGISVCTYKDGVPYLLYLPFDFDSDNLKESWEDAKKLYNYLIKYGYGACLNFSGRKGFHVFAQTIPAVYTRRQIRLTQIFFKNLLGLKTLDEQILGDIRRLMRIPGTYNINGGLCRTLAEEDGRLLNINDIAQDAPRKEIDPKDSEILTGYHDYPCIEQYILDRDYWHKNHPRHKFEPVQIIRYTWVILRNAQGYTEDEIVDEAANINWDDYEEDKTRYQIQHIVGGGYVPPSCKTLKELGYCTKDCKFEEDELNGVGIV